jgi:hypothetical protein
MSNPICETCRWWKEMDLRRLIAIPLHFRAGECHRRAPVVGCPDWPRTEPAQWCGDHAPVPSVAGSKVETCKEDGK